MFFLNFLCFYNKICTTLRSIGKAATSVLPPFTVIHLFYTQKMFLQVSLWSSVRSRRSACRWIFQLQKQTCQKLWPLRALEFEARLLLPNAFFQVDNLSSRSACGGQRDDLPHRSCILHLPLRQLSNSSACFADAWVWKAFFSPVVVAAVVATWWYSKLAGGTGEITFI